MTRTPDAGHTATAADATRAADAEILADACWPGPADADPPPLAGFVISDFSPMAAAAADRCLGLAYGSPTAISADDDLRRRAERTAIIVASRGGDLITNTSIATAVDAGEAVAPLLFFQSVPNAVAGHIARRWGLAGPVICFSPSMEAGDPLGEAMDVAHFLALGGDADEALVLLVEQLWPSGERGSARALLLRPVSSTGRAMA
jgi:hypothetical protein